MREDEISIIDDDGKEKLMKIYLTFAAEDNKYVVVYDESNEDELYSFRYDDEGNLYMIESDEELQMIEEVIGAYGEEEEKE